MSVDVQLINEADIAIMTSESASSDSSYTNCSQRSSAGTHYNSNSCMSAYVQQIGIAYIAFAVKSLEVNSGIWSWLKIVQEFDDSWRWQNF